MINTLIEPEIVRSSQVVASTEQKKKEIWFRRLAKFDFKGAIKKFFSKATVVEMQRDGRVALSMLSFLGLVLMFLVEFLGKIIFSVLRLPKLFSGKGSFWQSKFGPMTEGLINFLESKEGVKRTFLIGLAFRNMKVKKMRSLVTVGGVSMGIGAIVFLVSLGYGVQRLVVGRVAKLNDLRMADVLLGKSSLLKLDDGALAMISNIDKVESVMPIVSLVGNVDYMGSTSEVVAYAVTGDYMKVSNLSMIKGGIFDAEGKRASGVTIPAVAGVSTEWKFEKTEKGVEIRKVNMNILEDEWMKVRKEPSISSEVLGYAKRYEGGYDGVEYWGDSFVSTGPEGNMARNSAGESLGKWIKAPFLLYEKNGDEYEPIMDNNLHDWREGYVAELADIVTLSEQETYRVSGLVLGDSTDSAAVQQSSPVLAGDLSSATISAKVVGVDAAGVEWVELEGGAENEQKEATIIFSSTAQKVAVVNNAFLEATGIDPANAVGQVFKVSLLISKALKGDLDRSARSEVTEYKISGVFDGGNSPLMYIPLDDALSLGITNYSQAKIMVGAKEDLKKVRDQVDGFGYQTSSVADTVAQIDQMFATIRLVLASFGLVALAVASLGMFNTMTVSLMERTHEVGVMKAMGMLSSEVKELFMAEAMVMGIMGGVMGVAIGFLVGELLGLVLSIFSLSSGIGWVSVSYIPAPFVIFILALSFVVGVSTGIYPARRATRISALDALRYE